MLNEATMTNEELLAGIQNLIERNRELESALERVRLQVDMYRKARVEEKCFENQTKGANRKRATALNYILGLERACEKVELEILWAIAGGEFWKHGPFNPKSW
jgi:hypothetical protein